MYRQTLTLAIYESSLSTKTFTKLSMGCKSIPSFVAFSPCDSASLHDSRFA